jgi:Zn-dependent alcohol dehydrogenase
MKAIVQDRYGSTDVLELRDIGVPVVGEKDVLVRVHTAGCGPDVWHTMTGQPYLARLMLGFGRPKLAVRGGDVAGAVEAVGQSVTDLHPGDEVMGVAAGSFAELPVGPADKLVRKSARLSFEEAAAVPISGLTALQAIRDEGRVQPDQKVLIIGAAGGVGTLAVQIAKAFGARHRCVQHFEDGPRPADRWGRGDRLHERGVRGRNATLGLDRRHRRQAVTVSPSGGTDSERDPRDRRRWRWALDGRLLPRDAPRARAVDVRGSEAARPDLEGETGGPPDLERADRSGQGHASH